MDGFVAQLLVMLFVCFFSSFFFSSLLLLRFSPYLFVSVSLIESCVAEAENLLTFTVVGDLQR